MVHPPDRADLPGSRGGGASHGPPSPRRRAGRHQGQDLTPPQRDSEGEGKADVHKFADV